MYSCTMYHDNYVIFTMSRIRILHRIYYTHIIRSSVIHCGDRYDDALDELDSAIQLTVAMHGQAPASGPK
jgi:hypothetical protein